MIPKKIHYCWFGSAVKNATINNCIDSWKVWCPDYEIIEWNENNADLSNKFLKNALHKKKWAFAADVCRLDALSEHGGIYLDTDMLLLKNLDDFLSHDCFLGMEENHIVSGGIIGASRNNILIKSVREVYDSLTMPSETDYYNITIPIILTEKVTAHIKMPDLHVVSPVTINGITLYQPEVFYPFPNRFKNDILNLQSYITTKSAAVHLWNASWVTLNEFDYLLKKKYGKAAVLIAKTIFSRKINLYYFKRVFKHFKISLSS